MREGFELWEEREHVVHDSPTIGVWQELESSRDRRGSFGTMEAAREAMNKLAEKYLAEGWRQRSSKRSTEDEVHLLGNGNPGTIDLDLSIVEKTITWSPP